MNEVLNVLTIDVMFTLLDPYHKAMPNNLITDYTDVGGSYTEFSTDENMK